MQITIEAGFELMFILSLKKVKLNGYYIPGIFLDIKNITVNQTDMNTAPWSLESSSRH